ncbi:hypothetical protein RFM26_09785 [Mesorhizobium sp. VK23B]|uniref:N-acetyltransferase domain-containing protein n=1 Tax=Mesorhizobium dulcispinae TaxID=3072316 RepID=A0ABU4XAF1_9HYPH|nr:MULTISPECIES: hypothetical protein [unclassified Mesorhizobium]MDX8465969.1 hypothetical protein [Mesorhizobium sp. VK23B]MDX8471780.1 hypothetical protein [Mesorhizobium sp. VK23A]
MTIEIEGIPLDALRALSHQEQDELLSFSRPISFMMGSATVLAEFNQDGKELTINLAHIDGGGEGVLLVLWRALRAYATERDYHSIRWNVHALTCAKPNPRLKRFLRTHSFSEVDDPSYGPIFTRTTKLLVAA